MRWDVPWVAHVLGGEAPRTILAHVRRFRDRHTADSLPLIDWCRRFVPHYFYLPPRRMHQWLSRRLGRTGRGSRLSVVAPRDSAKTTWLSFAYPLYCALTRREAYILLVADTAEQACRYLQSIAREIEANTAIHDTYPDAKPGKVWRDHRIVLANGVEIEAISTGQNLRGRRNAQQRPTLVVVDDPQGRRKAVSPKRRAGDWSWFTQDLLNVGSPRTNYVVAGTSLHRESLVDRLMRHVGWEARRFAAIERFPDDAPGWKHWESIYTDRANPHAAEDAAAYHASHREQLHRGATVCWPQREDLHDLMRRRVEIGRTAFEAEKQGNPLNPELCEWPLEYFDASAWFDEWPPQLAVKTLALDPSKGRDAAVGDYSAFVMLGADAAGTLYVEADLRRRPAEEIVAAGVEWYRQFQPDAFGCEANAWQDLLAADFAEEFARRGMLGVRPWSMDNHQPKVVRIRRLGPWLSQRRLRFKTSSAGTALLVDQLKDFPIGQHDDGPDALEMALRLAQELVIGHDDGLGDRIL